MHYFIAILDCCFFMCWNMPFSRGICDWKAHHPVVFFPMTFPPASSWVLGRHVVYVNILCKRYVQNFWQHGRRTNINTFLSVVKHMLTQNYSSIWLNEGIVLLHGRSYSFTCSVNIAEILLILQGWIHLYVELLPHLTKDTS